MAKVNGAASTLRKAKVPKPAEASNESTKHEEKTAGDVSSDDDSSTSASEDEEEGQDVSKKGLARLMQALGEDGLSEMDKVHLGIVTGEGEGDEDDEFDDDEEDDEDESEAEEDEEISIDDANDDSQDEEDEEEDAVPASGKGKDSLAASLARSGLIAEVDEEDDEEMEDGEDEDDAVPLDSLSEAALAALPDTVRLSRVNREKINNEDALRRIRQDIALGSSSKKGSLPWIETLVVSYDKSIEEELGAESSAITDDDLKRELEFYKQALYTAVQGRQLAKQADLPFTRPSDYFAEMVKSDEHMERVRQKLLDERAGLKASEEAKRQRELKKFGKKVQVEKQLERTRSRKELDEKVKGLKRKHKGGLDGDGDGDDDGDDFDIQLESAITGSDKNKRSRGEASPRGRGGAASRGRGGGRMSRDSRDAKFGFGGKKRHAKENTRESTNDMSTGVYRGPSSRGSSRGGRGGAMRGGGRGAKRGGGRGGRGAAKRPGKARRSGGGRN